MAIAFGGAVYAWNSGQTIGLFVCSGILWIIFSVQQAFSFLTTPEDRLFAVEFLKLYELCILFAQVAAAVTGVFVPTYFTPLFFQFARNDTALKAGVRLLPFVLVLVSIVVFNGKAMGKTGYYIPWYLAGGIIATIGSALMYTVKLDTSPASIHGYSIVLAFGTGLFSQACFSIAQAKVKPEQAAITGASSDLFDSLADEQRERVLEAIVSAMSNAYIMTMTGALLTVILSVFMKRGKLFLAPGAAAWTGV